MPTRYLKPGIRDSATIDQLSPLAEILFYRLLVTVDDFGRYDARPALIKAQCFPVKDSVTIKKCQELLSELANAGLLLIYSSGGKEYMQLQRWDNKPRATESNFPAFADTCIQTYTDVKHPHTNVPLTVTETKTETKTGTARDAPPDGVSPSVWADFQKLRKTKKAPVTQTAIDGIKREADRAGLSLEAALAVCCQRGWTGFKADWMAQPVNLNDVAAVTVPGRQGIDPALAKVIADASRAAPPSAEIRAKLQTIRNQG
jgi:hypothetical protein